MPFNMSLVEEARIKAEMARKARAEGNLTLAGEFYRQAAARYRDAGMTLVAANVMKQAKKLPPRPLKAD
jgi:hypothetical protein